MHSQQISDAELQRRWDAMRSHMLEHGIDCVLTQGSNDWLGGYVRWLTGTSAYYGYPRAVLLFADGRMIAVEHGAQGASRSPDPAEIAYRGIDRVLFSASYVSACFTWTYDAALAIGELTAAGVKRLGLLGAGAGYHGFVSAVVEWALSFGVETVDVTAAVDRLKAVKSSEEQALIRQAAALQDQVMEEVGNFLEPGLRDFEVAAHARRVAQDLGSEQGVYLCGSAQRGSPALFRQKYAQTRKIEAGDSFVILVETNGPGGFYTEIARTFVLGKADDALREGTDAAIEAQAYVLELLKPGTAWAEVIDRFNGYMRERGLPEEERLFCHGQGYDLVERPLAREDESFVVKAGMNIVVHPSFLAQGIFAQVCDNYLIGEEGPGECLHRTPKQVIEL